MKRPTASVATAAAATAAANPPAAEAVESSPLAIRIESVSKLYRLPDGTAFEAVKNVSLGVTQGLPARR